MSTGTITTERIASGRYRADRIHSHADFEVEHLGLSLFRAGFDDLEAELAVAEDGSMALTGDVSVASIQVEEETLKGHLQSPDFFDAERHPRIRFESDSIVAGDDGLVVSGELEIAGTRKPVSATGELRGPVTGMAGTQVLALRLEADVDRTEYGLGWNAELPDGGFALGNEVKLAVVLELSREDA